MKKIFKKIDALLSKEKGSITKDPGGKNRICLIYPNIYQVGISNLGFQTVYRIFNSRDDVVCERAFLPAQDDMKFYEDGHSLVSMESRTPVHEFDIIAFSLSFENDYPNILKILKLSKIPFFTVQRSNAEPLLIAGGVLCFSNPEPIADIFDIIFVGEAEALIHRFIEVYSEVKKSSYREDFKKALKLELLDKEGFYIPEAYKEIYDSKGKLRGRKAIWQKAPEKIKRVYCENLSDCFAFSQVLSSSAVFSDMYLLETMRGCPFKCRFCLAGHVYQPVRKVPFESLKEKIDHARNLSPASIGLIAPSLSAYKELKELIKISGIELSFTSLRADRTTLEVLDEISKKCKTLTLAPEAGSERLRRAIKKGISEEDLLMIAKKLSYTKLQTLKLYFMIGLPFERQKDIEEIVVLLKKLRNVFHRRITASISIFVPKPFTPFQWHSMEIYEVVKERLNKLKKDTLQIKGFSLFHEVPKYSYMQGYLSKADRRAIFLIERVSEGENFKRLMDNVKQDIYKTKSFKDFLPWEFIDHGRFLSKEILWKDYEKAKVEAKLQTESI